MGGDTAREQNVTSYEEDDELVLLVLVNEVDVVSFHLVSHQILSS